MLVAGLYGLAEKKAKADDTFILNRLPKPITALGYTGNVAAALYIGTMFTPNKWVRLAARATAMVAAYQMAKNGGPFSSVAILGGIDGEDEQLIDANVMGALEAEAMDHNTQPGLKYDDVVRDADGRV